MKKNWLNTFRKFFKLSFGQKILLFRVLISMLLISFLLSTLPFHTFKKFYKTYSSFQFSKIKDPNNLFYLTKVVGNTLPTIFTCLPIALTAKSFLGNDPNYRLILGINNNKDKFEAHAWLANNEIAVLGELPLESFVPIWDWK